MPKSCYWPQGDVGTAVGFVPCYPNAEVSPCCSVGDNCLGGGLCYGNEGYVYRGSCTDRSSKAPECSQVCDNRNNNIIPCDIAVHGGQGIFACACNSPQLQDCCIQNFTLSAGFGAILVVNITGEADSSAASSVRGSQPLGTSSLASSQMPTTGTSSPTPSQVLTTETTTSASSHVGSSDTTVATSALFSTTTIVLTTQSPATPLPTHSKSTTVIAAISVCLGIFFIAVVLYFFLLERKQRRRLEQQVAALSIHSSTTRYQISHPVPRQHSSPSDRNELPGDRGIELPVDRQIPEMQ